MVEKKPEQIAAVLELSIALLLIVGIWVALPARWWPLDVTGSLLAGVLAVAGGSLLLGKEWGRRLSIVAGWITLATGMVTVTMLALTLFYLVGLYGPVGKGGALILGAVAVLLLPYLVGLPLIQLILLRKGR
jgi:hypothetical protein